MSQSDREQYGGCGDAQSRQDQLLPRLQNALHQSYGDTFSRPCAAPTREQVASYLADRRLMAKVEIPAQMTLWPVVAMDVGTAGNGLGLTELIVGVNTVEAVSVRVA